MPGKKRIVTITGATGFVGRATVARLLEEKNVQVRCMLRPGSDRSALAALSGSLSYCEGDITRPDTLEAAFDGSWGVINLAGYREFWARDRQHFYTINQQGAENVFRACLAVGVDKVVQVSTPLAYGVPKKLPFNESSAPGPHPSDYGRSKHLGDNAGWSLYKESGLPLTIVYLAAVIGAGDDKATMEVRRAVEKKLPALVGADTTYTYLYRGDAAEAITRALLAPDSVGQRFLIGDQRATTREYFNIIGDLADVPIPRANIPERWLLPTARAMEWVARRTGKRPVIPLDVIKTTAAGSLLFSAEKSKRKLKLQYTPLQEALAESVAEIQQESG
ncbi:NAD-dependent epimerase/dehydratase family protein [Pseudohalioglobus sediminis]|uniref:NAD-dependent epimerase/dehydratase family protein n=1 Tax=Pseudohalioglobus sediminis TaxID=2606449 RepID=A0A5B0WY85_9GAMM|nr:NAD-dependent epimerase/dehydratase family protein [Pseudohalioglobus sediminis]KAA1191946.1 NAD-dependent epimerase/dehydratase family protein [Pseudohalioglobus sediminis]